MDGAFDIPDSTDWLDTPLKDFSTLENALHCEICKEFYDTPMITSCSHTFCSKCIRTALSTDGRCPSCRTQDQASKLRNNLALQEVVVRFLAARPKALDMARNQKESDETESGKGKRGKRKRVVQDSDDIAQSQEDGRTTRSKSRKLAASQTSEPETIEVIDSESDFEPEKPADDGLVECPLGCGKRMKIEAVEPHLDRCEDEKKQASRAKSKTPVSMFGSSRPSSAQNGKPPERISELNQALFNDTKLRAKLNQIGIPSWGQRKLMIRRHTEWVNIWNANCDSKNPRSERELLRELDQWERTQGGRAPQSNGLSSTIMKKDFDGAAWTNRNKDDFSRLIAEAKRKKNNPAMEAERPKVIEDSEDPTKVEINGESVDSSSLPPVTSQSSPPPPDPAKPYENNPEAISSIREKVQAANAGRPIEPAMNAGFENPSLDGANEMHAHGQPNLKSPPLVPGVENPSLLGQSHFGLANGPPIQRTPSGDKVVDSSPVKVPMFAVPARPFNDVDGAGDGNGSH